MRCGAVRQREFFQAELNANAPIRLFGISRSQCTEAWSKTGLLEATRSGYQGSFQSSPALFAHDLCWRLRYNSAVESLKFDANGLIVALCQDHVTGDIRMVAWMNAEALAVTLQSGLATFFSRSRGRLWTKGETSGNHLRVVSVHVDCDQDTLLLRVAATGPACHTGQPTCFFQRLDGSGDASHHEQPAAHFLAQLEHELIARQHSSAEKSYTKSLLTAGAGKIGEKILEEAGEFTTAMSSESDERVVNEAADVLYHLMVGLRLRDLPFSRVLETLESRSKQSGLAEKAQRSTPRT